MAMDWCPTKTIKQLIPPQSISLSKDSLRMAVSIRNIGVRLFERASIGGNWNELQSIGTNQISLKSSSNLSKNGDVIAINGGSATKTFKYEKAAKKWKQYGSAMRVCKGAVEKDVSLSLSSDGTKLAVSANCGKDTFNTQVFQYNSTDNGVWKAFSEVFHEMPSESKVQLSGDGTIFSLPKTVKYANAQCFAFYQYEQAKEWDDIEGWCNGADSVEAAFTESGKRAAVVWTTYNEPNHYMEVFECTYNAGGYCRSLIGSQFNSAINSAINPQFDANGTTIAYADTSQSNIKVRNFKMKTTHTIGNYSIPIFAMSKNGKSIAVRTDNKSITVYDYGPGPCNTTTLTADISNGGSDTDTSQIKDDMKSLSLDYSSNLFDSSFSISLLPILAIMIVAFCFFVRRR